MEATLRTYMQRCPNASFVFSGSHRHLMDEMFASPSRPFYQSVTLFNLRPISLENYKEFATDKFEQAGKRLDEAVVDEVYERFSSITSYMQKVMNYLYQVTETGSTCSTDMIDTAVNYILDLSSDTYQAILYQMPEKQRNVLLAIAREKKAISISSGAFAKRNHLPSPSAVVSAVRGLLEKDFITQEANAYMIYDRFFQLWLEREVV